jgi:predicted phage terminase large subunit-like protein
MQAYDERVQIRRVPVQIPGLLMPLLDLGKWRFKIMYGGRGGAKSHSAAQALIMLADQNPLRIACCREVQKTLAESSKQVIEDYIDRMGVADSFSALKNAIIHRRTGSTFGFHGLREHTAKSIKSLENVHIAWVEEADSVSKRSWEMLIPTIRPAQKGAVSEIWGSFNPDKADDYVYDRFVAHTDPDALVIPINWRDNPFFPAVLEAERIKMRALNEDLYQHIWEGKCRTEVGLMFKRTMFSWYDRLPDRLALYMASDYAVTQDGGDFTEHGIFGLDESGETFLVDWWYGQTAPEAWIEAAVHLLRTYKPLMWFEEKGQILRALDAAIAARLFEQDPPVWVYRFPLASAGNKAARAMGFLARCSAGKVHVPRGAPWAVRLVNQLCAFTGEKGRIDDGVDVCSLFARGLDATRNAPQAPPDEKPPFKPFTRAHFEGISVDEAEERERRREYYS